MNRFILILKTFLFALLASTHAVAGDKVSIQDLAGRTVTLKTPVQTMILGEGRYLPTIGILDRDNPIHRIVGLMGEFQKYDPATYQQYLKYFPGLTDIPSIGATGSASFNVETSLTIRPDVTIFGLGSGHGPNDKSKTVLAQLEKAGIPVIILDFRIDPLVNTPKSLSILGKIMGREKEAAEFLAFYHKELEKVRSRITDVKNKPSVFMESRVGLMPQCCEVIGRAMMGRFIEWAGGQNAYGNKIPGTHGTVDREHLLVHQPEIYIGTAIGNVLTENRFPKFLSLGVGTNEEAAKASLVKSLDRQELNQLRAIRQGKAHAIWHHFYNTPMNVVAVQRIAKWLHPDRFADLHPEETLKTYFKEFQPVPLEGVYWVSADKK
ncbi:MAG: ABC transporter substrate-binding protein [Sneathiellales bacterium]|nr:ABC transporter substrate-binding protein [Sneathiellales bacterium]